MFDLSSITKRYVAGGSERTTRPCCLSVIVKPGPTVPVMVCGPAAGAAAFPASSAPTTSSETTSMRILVFLLCGFSRPFPRSATPKHCTGTLSIFRSVASPDRAEDLLVEISELYAIVLRIARRVHDRDEAFTATQRLALIEIVAVGPLRVGHPAPPIGRT